MDQPKDEGETCCAMDGREAETDVGCVMWIGRSKGRVMSEGEDDLWDVAATGTQNHFFEWIVLNQLAGGGRNVKKEL